MRINMIVQETIAQIKQLYLADTRPWVIGYSGGKDSSAVAQIVCSALLELAPEQRHKPVYIISSDTLVETPLIIDYITNNLQKINEFAAANHLPVSACQVRPPFEQSFWVSLIGKGYPTPRQKFRWCTDRLKIAPTSQFIRDKVSEFGEVIVVLGVRNNESATRNAVMNSHKVEGRIFRKHTTLNNAYIYAPIEDFTTDDVWAYLLQFPCPWGTDNYELHALYKDSQAGECPLVLDKNSPSCGNSRFGCWVCTVVEEDKALLGFIESGYENLIPLLQYRNEIKAMRDNPDNREKKRMNGRVYYVGQGEERRIGLGPFTLEARKKMLELLLQTQRKINVTLIQDEELWLIRECWQAVGDWEDSLPKSYEAIMGIPWQAPYSENPPLEAEDFLLLNQLCLENQVDEELFRRLVNLEKDYYGYKHRYSILKKFDSLLHQDWVHFNELEGVENAD